eukprot:06755_6
MKEKINLEFERRKDSEKELSALRSQVTKQKQHYTDAIQTLSNQLFEKSQVAKSNENMINTLSEKVHRLEHYSTAHAKQKAELR